MYPTFEYHRPEFLGRLFALMEQAGGEGRVYGGGTDLLVQLRAGACDAGHLLDVKGIPALTAIREAEDGILIGGAVSFHAIHSSPLVARWAGALAQAARSVGSVQIRYKATLGGNIQTASPAGDGLVAALGLDATLRLTSQQGSRSVPLEQFVLAPRQTALAPGEVIEAVILPKREWSHQHFFKVGRRNALAISVVNGVVALRVGQDGTVTDARVALGAVGPVPMRIKEAEGLLRGSPVTPALRAAVAEAVRRQVRPISDIRAGAAYRSYMAGVEVSRALEQWEGGTRQ